MNFTPSETLKKPEPQTKTPTARDLMTKKLISFQPDDDVYMAIDALLKNRISGAPVIDKGRLAGVLSENDCLKVLAHKSFEQMPRAKVRDYMSPGQDCRTIGPDTDIFKIADIFLREKFRRLPVVDDGIVVGQVSRKDVLQYIHYVHHKR